MRWYMPIILAVLLGQTVSITRCRAEQTLAWISRFQSGSVAAVDPMTGAVANSISVDDGAAIAAVAWSAAADSRLFVLDGAQKSRLRMLDAGNLSVMREVDFTDRVLRFNDFRLLYPSADGRFLFIGTYEPRDTSYHVRIFDVANWAFEKTQLAGTSCGDPALASSVDGTIFALCPREMIATRFDQRGGQINTSRHAIPLVNVFATVASPDGTDVYAIGARSENTDWALMKWHPGDADVTVRDAATVLALPEQELLEHRQFWLGCSRDGRHIIAVRDARVWIMDRDLHVIKRVTLPSAARAAALDPVSDSLITLHFETGAKFYSLATVPLAQGGPTAVATRLGGGLEPVSFAAGGSSGRH
jgi:hypothetical protein